MSQIGDQFTVILDTPDNKIFSMRSFNKKIIYIGNWDDSKNMVNFKSITAEKLRLEDLLISDMHIQTHLLR